MRVAIIRYGVLSLRCTELVEVSKHWLLLFGFLFASGAQAAESLTLGIFAYRPKALMEKTHQPLAAYLSEQLKIPVQLRVLDQDEMEAALTYQQLDFLMTNPSHYLMVRSRNSLTGALATQVTLENDLAVNSLGGVIFTQAENAAIQHLQDLRGQRIAVPGMKYLGGYQTQAFELMQVGIHLPGDADLVIVGSHDAVVQEVLAGRVDAGFIRTGVIESLAAAGQLDPARLKILNPQQLTEFPFRVSTRLYPEWPFLALPHVDKDIVRRVASLLLALEPQHPAARAASIAGFSPPLDYLPVEHLARSLRLPPFDRPPQFIWQDVWDKYWLFFISASAVFVVIGFLLFLLSRRNHQLHALEMRWRTIVAAEPECIKLLDQKGRLLQMNRAGLDMIEADTLAQVQGQPVLDLIAPQHRAAYAQLHQRVMAGEQVRMEYEVIGLKGGKRWLETHAVRLDDGGEPVHLAVTRDISQRKKMEEALERERSLLKTLIRTIPDLVWLKDCHGVYLGCNPRFEHFFGTSEAEIIGKTDYDFVPKEIADTFRHYDQIALTTRSLSVNEEWVTFIDGHRELLETSKAAVVDSQGNLMGVLGIGHDITARKQAEKALLESEKLHKAITDTSPLAVYMSSGIDQQARYINPTFTKLFGYTIDEVPTVSAWWPLAYPDEAYRHQVATEWQRRVEIAIKTYSVIEPMDVVVTCKDGSKRNITWRFVSSGDQNWAFGLDYTERKQFEQELIQARQAADTANQAKSAFIANMSHELRTPLNAIMGFAQILCRDNSLTEHQRGQAQSILRGGEYLLTLINDILDLAKIEAGRFELFPAIWDTRSFLMEISYMFRIRSEQKGLLFQYAEKTPLPYSLRCDDKRLRQVLINLLGNAVKFTECGGVTLRTGYTGGKLCLEVQDSGIGIAAADIERIFDPFQQTGSDRYKIQGTGLGLAITQRLVENMGGTLGVESEPGKGSVFRVEIPAEAVSTAAEAREAVEEKAEIIGYQRDNIRSGELISPAPFRLLAVDDLEINREVLRVLLEPLGFAIAQASSGEACLQSVAQNPPDAVIMDLRMPGMNGLQATRALRDQGFTMPIIALSASAFADDRAASREAGCDAHLSKPVRLAELLAALGQFLPLEWMYAETPQAGEALALETLPPEQAERFLHLVRMGDIQGLGDFARHIQASCPAFAAQLGNLADECEVAAIRDLARGYGAR